MNLNQNAARLADRMYAEAGGLRVGTAVVGGARLIDCGVNVQGGLDAGLLLAEICMGGLGSARLEQATLSDIPQVFVQVKTDQPLLCCMGSQYAGWQIKRHQFFAMGSGPFRILARVESLFDDLGIAQSCDHAVGVLETSSVPNEDVVGYISDKTSLDPSRITLLVAPTSSQAGTVQVVARSVETCLHKLHELGFDLGTIDSAHGRAPLPPVAKDDLTAIGRTNDAVLYGGSAILWVRCDDAQLVDLGPKVPSTSSQAYGSPFVEIFKEAGGDFYKIDPNLFSPAEVLFQNLVSGNSFRFGKTNPSVIRRSFGYGDP